MAFRRTAFVVASVTFVIMCVCAEVQAAKVKSAKQDTLQHDHDKTSAFRDSLRDTIHQMHSNALAYQAHADSIVFDSPATNDVHEALREEFNDAALHHLRAGQQDYEHIMTMIGVPLAQSFIEAGVKIPGNIDVSDLKSQIRKSDKAFEFDPHAEQDHVDNLGARLGLQMLLDVSQGSTEEEDRITVVSDGAACQDQMQRDNKLRRMEREELSTNSEDAFNRQQSELNIDDGRLWDVMEDDATASDQYSTRRDSYDTDRNSEKSDIRLTARGNLNGYQAASHVQNFESGTLDADSAKFSSDVVYVTPPKSVMVLNTIRDSALFGHMRDFASAFSFQIRTPMWPPNPKRPPFVPKLCIVITNTLAAVKAIFGFVFELVKLIFTIIAKIILAIVKGLVWLFKKLFSSVSAMRPPAGPPEIKPLTPPRSASNHDNLLKALEDECAKCEFATVFKLDPLKFATAVVNPFGLLDVELDSPKDHNLGNLLKRPLSCKACVHKYWVKLKQALMPSDGPDPYAPYWKQCRYPALSMCAIIARLQTCADNEQGHFALSGFKPSLVSGDTRKGQPPKYLDATKFCDMFQGVSLRLRDDMFSCASPQESAHELNLRSGCMIVKQLIESDRQNIDTCRFLTQRPVEEVWNQCRGLLECVDEFPDFDEYKVEKRKEVLQPRIAQIKRMLVDTSIKGGSNEQQVREQLRRVATQVAEQTSETVIEEKYLADLQQWQRLYQIRRSFRDTMRHMGPEMTVDGRCLTDGKKSNNQLRRQLFTTLFDHLTNELDRCTPVATWSDPLLTRQSRK
eukprot:GFYU01010513.1.p1 GENE.GFYU01010513.1~~GFYU01010513.1.p1  ORF type:complete len:853 (+),score=193.60 GFYU01010513.1:176-2560(+)